MKTFMSNAIAPFVGLCAIVSGTARTVHSAMERTNQRIEMAGERKATMNRVRDQMAKDNFDMEVIEHLVNFGLREKDAEYRALELDEKVRERLKQRQEQYGVLLGKDPYDVSPSSEPTSA